MGQLKAHGLRKSKKKVQIQLHASDFDLTITAERFLLGFQVEMTYLVLS